MHDSEWPVGEYNEFEVLQRSPFTRNFLDLGLLVSDKDKWDLRAADAGKNIVYQLASVFGGIKNAATVLEANSRLAANNPALSYNQDKIRGIVGDSVFIGFEIGDQKGIDNFHSRVIDTLDYLYGTQLIDNDHAQGVVYDLMSIGVVYKSLFKPQTTEFSLTQTASSFELTEKVTREVPPYIFDAFKDDPNWG